MMFLPSAYSKQQRAGSRPVMLLLAIIVLLLLAPDTFAACGNIDNSDQGSDVRYVDCSEVQDNNGGAIVLAPPASVVVGDLLLLAIATDGNPAIGVDPDWNEIDNGSNGNSMSLRLWSRVADGSATDTVTFNVANNEDVYAWMMLFTGHDGIDPAEIAALTGNGDIATAPAIVTAVDNSYILRIAGADDDDGVINPAPVITGYQDITQNESGGGNGTTSGAAAYTNQAVAGNTGTQAFNAFPRNNGQGGSEQWRAVTLAIRPLPQPGFSIGHSGAATTCTDASVTIVALDSSDQIDTAYTGTISISTSTGNGAWVLDTGNGSFTPGPGDGTATYTFAGGDNGQVVLRFLDTTVETVNINITDGSFTEKPAFDPDLVVSACSTSPGVFNGAVSCENNSDGVLVHAAGIPSSAATDRMVLLTWSGEGNPSLPTNATFNGVPMSLVESVTLDDGGFDTTTEIYAILSADLPAAAGSSYLAILNGAAPNFAMCLMTLTGVEQAIPPGSGTGLPVNSTAVDDPAAVADITTTITTQVADSFVVSAVGNGSNGSYTGHSLFEWYDVQIGGTGAVFSLSGETVPTQGVVNITDTASVNPNRASQAVAAFAPAPTPATQFSILHNLGGGVCTPNIITISAINATGQTDPGYTGTVTASSSVGSAGSWSLVSGNPANFTANPDGTFSYTYDGSESGAIQAAFSVSSPTVVNFDVTDGSLSESAFYDADLDIQNCSFRISHSGSAVTCTPETITIGAYDNSGNLLTGFTGSISLTTSTNGGTWQIPAAGDIPQGLLTDPVSDDGAATYNFDIADGGTIELELLTPTLQTLNIDVTDGQSSEDVAFDPDLLVTACSFRISVAAGSISACSSETVTIEVYDSGGSPATGYTGTVELTTSTADGDWFLSSGNGSLVDINPGDGLALYSFDAADNGSVDLAFTHEATGVVNVDLSDGSQVEDPGFDPDITITSCIPQVAAQCFAQGNLGAANINLNSSTASNGSRMLLMFINDEATLSAVNAELTGPGPTTYPLTFIRQELNSNGPGNTLEVWGALDADLPADAGNYAAAFSGPDAGAAMCLVSVEGVEQTFPAYNATTPADGQLNSSQGVTTQVASTTVTTEENNSVIISAVSTGADGSSYTSSLGTSLWAAGSANPDGAEFFGSSEVIATASQITVTETNSTANPNRHTHMVLALSPLVSGNPVVTGYVPVDLFQTYAGNVNYRTIGNSLRTADNPNSCSFFPEATGSTYTLDIPAGSTILDAYLYWAASGTQGQVPDEIDNIVSFGPDGSQVAITADDVFLVENPLGIQNGLNFFLAWKQVTGLVSTGASTTYRLSDLTVQTTGPWAFNQTCLGGWSLVVVYENPLENLNVVNLFHGFQPFQNSSFLLTPRNFRVALPDVPADLPNGQMSHVTFEGDNTLNTGDEAFRLQNDPNALTFDDLNNPFNLGTAQYNNTVSMPDYDGSLNFLGTYSGSTTSYGTDVDTYYIQGANPGDTLNLFALIEAEEIITRYSAGQDLVMLGATMISITSAPIADMEVFISAAGSFVVDSVAGGTFAYSVVNNGNGTGSGGEATGDIILTGNLPVGMSINTLTPNGWDCSTIAATGSAFTCIYEIAADYPGGQLPDNTALPDVVLTVDIDNESSYPLLDNTVSQVARIAHTGDYTSCTLEPAGIQPDPRTCDRSPQFDNVNDLDGFAIDIDDLDEKAANNNNVVSQDTLVRGVATDLAISKSVVGVLEQGQSAIYELVITNNGPDATTKTIAVADALPSGIVPVSATGTDWVCNIVGQNIDCSRSSSLASGSSSAIMIVTDPLVSPAIAGSNAINTAAVEAGFFNFDLDNSNNADTDITQVLGAVIAGSDRIILSVSENSSLGGLGPFEAGDLVLFDPATDSAELFLDVSVLTGTAIINLNAVHVLPNGQILLSSDQNGSSIAGQGFDAGDIVLYDPVLGTASIIFSGSALFDAPADIDALYVIYNDSYTPADWDLVISSSDTVSISATSYQDNDLLLYDVSTGTASLLIDGASGDVFNGSNGDIDAVYIREADEDGYILSSNDSNTTIAINGASASYTQDDLVEYNSGLVSASQYFVGDAAPGVFSPASAARKLDAAHLVEDSYLGHFSISHSSSGDVCTPASITISKHLGLGHSIDVAYTGSILISNDIAQGAWSKDASANGTLTDLGGGVARYTFVPADNGEVTLTLTQTTATTVNIDVTNTLTTELNSEDQDIVIAAVNNTVNYIDQFSSVAYSNNDGNASFAGNWTESADDGDAAAGSIMVQSGALVLTDPLQVRPAISRVVNFSTYTAGDIVVSFDWQTGNVSPSDSILVQANDGLGGWQPLGVIAGLTGPNSGSSSIVITDPPYSLSSTDTGSIEISIQVNGGYLLEDFSLDNFRVETTTSDCNAGNTLDHYAVLHSGNLVSCLSESVTISPHSISDTVVAPGPGVTILLNTVSGKGTWNPPLNGSGAFSAVPGTGQATYTFLAGETEITFPFNFTNPTGSSEAVFFTVQDDDVPANVQLEAPPLTVSTAGLRFFNDSAGNDSWPTLVAGMNSLLYTGQTLTVQAIQVSDGNPAVCENIFSPGVDVNMELAFECIDSDQCAAAAIPVELGNNTNNFAIEPVDSNGLPGVNSGGYTPVTLRFETFSNGDFDQGGGDFSYTGAELQLAYADVGAMQIHGRYDVPLLEGAGAQTGNYLQGSGDNNFVVRPFGYDMDFFGDFDNDTVTELDRASRGNTDPAYSWAVDASGTAFLAAGAGFNTVVRAIAWQAVDDDGDNGGIANDGIPDPGADLFDNALTPGYGNESDPAEQEMTITHTLLAPTGAGTSPGILTGGNFNAFTGNGFASQAMSFNEVGIIELVASLDSGSYLGSGETVISNLDNVGRFIPADFEISNATLIPRPLFTPSSGPFTYMGEEFEIQLDITARNVSGVPTVNYLGGFAKLSSPSELGFFAVQDIASGGDDIDFSSRINMSMTNPVPADFSADWTAGFVSLSGNLIFNRNAAQTEEAPLTLVQVALTALDDDGVVDANRNVDDDDGTNEDTDFLYNLIDSHEFRYGRLRLLNVYGSEIPDEDSLGNLTGEDLVLDFVAEYYDGNGFVVNADDNATPYSSADLNFVPGSYTDNLNAGEVVITNSSGILLNGYTRNEGTNDAPVFLQAPGEGNEGSVLIEFDLDSANLDFLSFDWRSPGDLEDEIPDTDYSDNPRAQVNFGNFPGNDRIINWQEIVNP